MGWATARWIFIALAGLSLSGCQMFQGIFGGGRPDTPPPAADESGEWRQIATSADRDRLRRLRAAWTHALQQARAARPGQIGRASCRGRVCQYVYISVGAGSLNKKH